ncbi:MAG: hypothetical protein ACRDPH_12815 [Marmoricola sp.]
MDCSRTRPVNHGAPRHDRARGGQRGCTGARHRPVVVAAWREGRAREEQYAALRARLSFFGRSGRVDLVLEHADGVGQKLVTLKRSRPVSLPG